MRVLKLVNSADEELKSDEAAAYLGLTPRTLIQKIHMGSGPRHVRRFGRLWFRADDLRAFKKESEEQREAFRCPGRA